MATIARPRPARRPGSVRRRGRRRRSSRAGRRTRRRRASSPCAELRTMNGPGPSAAARRLDRAARRQAAGSALREDQRLDGRPAAAAAPPCFRCARPRHNSAIGSCSAGRHRGTRSQGVVRDHERRRNREAQARPAARGCTPCCRTRPRSHRSSRAARTGDREGDRRRRAVVEKVWRHGLTLARGLRPRRNISEAEATSGRSGRWRARAPRSPTARARRGWRRASSPTPESRRSAASCHGRGRGRAVPRPGRDVELTFDERVRQLAQHEPERRTTHRARRSRPA